MTSEQQFNELLPTVGVEKTTVAKQPDLKAAFLPANCSPDAAAIVAAIDRLGGKLERERILFAAELNEAIGRLQERIVEIVRRR